MTDSKMPEPVATVTHITPGIIADGKQERGITLNWLATDDLKIGSEIYAHPAPVADAELEALVQRLEKLADDMEKHATDEWDESEDVRSAITALRARTAQPVGVMSAATNDVLSERQRQVNAEGWTHVHDDAHVNGEMAQAAACYALNAAGWKSEALRGCWPIQWMAAWFKPTNRRRDLVKAGALILAEIERLDRAALLPEGGA